MYYLELFLKWVMWLMGILFFYLGMWTGLPPYQNAEFLSGLHWPSEHFRSDPPSLSRGLSSTPRKVLALDLARAATVYKFMEEICLSVNVQYCLYCGIIIVCGETNFQGFHGFSLSMSWYPHKLVTYKKCKYVMNQVNLSHPPTLTTLNLKLCKFRLQLFTNEVVWNGCKLKTLFSTFSL